jgi:hypothetical protein
MMSLSWCPTIKASESLDDAGMTVNVICQNAEEETTVAMMQYRPDGAQSSSTYNKCKS